MYKDPTNKNKSGGFKYDFTLEDWNKRYSELRSDVGGPNAVEGVGQLDPSGKKDKNILKSDCLYHS